MYVQEYVITSMMSGEGNVGRRECSSVPRHLRNAASSTSGSPLLRVATTTHQNLPPSALIKGTLKIQPAEVERLILISGSWADRVGFKPNSL